MNSLSLFSFCLLVSVLYANQNFCEDDLTVKIIGVQKQSSTVNLRYSNLVDSEEGTSTYELKTFDPTVPENEESVSLKNHRKQLHKDYNDISLCGSSNSGGGASSQDKPRFSIGSSQIYFISGFFFVKDRDGYSLMGLNQQWLGCPQPLCIFAQLDAAYTSGGQSYVIRGRHLWDTSQAPTSKSAKLFESINPGVPLYVDSAFGLGSERYFLRGKAVFCLTSGNAPCADGKARLQRLVAVVFDGNGFAPNYAVDAAFAAGSDSVVLFVFENSVKTASLMRKQNNSVFKMDYSVSINKGDVRIGLDAAYSRGSEVILFQRNKYFKGNFNPSTKEALSSWLEELEGDLAFKHHYNCPDEIYVDKEWILSPELYEAEFQRLIESNLNEENVDDALHAMKHGHPTVAKRTALGTAWLVFIIVAILVVLMIAIAAIVVVERRRRLKRRRTLDLLQRSESVDNRRYLAPSVSQHRSYISTNVVPSHYKPGPKLHQVKVVRPGSPADSSSYRNSSSSPVRKHTSTSGLTSTGMTHTSNNIGQSGTPTEDHSVFSPTSPRSSSKSKGRTNTGKTGNTLAEIGPNSRAIERDTFSGSGKFKAPALRR